MRPGTPPCACQQQSCALGDNERGGLRRSPSSGGKEPVAAFTHLSGYRDGTPASHMLGMRSTLSSTPAPSWLVRGHQSVRYGRISGEPRWKNAFSQSRGLRRREDEAAKTKLEILFHLSSPLCIPKPAVQSNRDNQSTFYSCPHGSFNPKAKPQRARTKRSGTVV